MFFQDQFRNKCEYYLGRDCYALKKGQLVSSDVIYMRLNSLVCLPSTDDDQISSDTIFFALLSVICRQHVIINEDGATSTANRSYLDCQLVKVKLRS